MSYSNGPKIVTSNLLICLDARNPKSNRGAGAIWADISGNNKHGTINGVGYSSSAQFGNTFEFDGVNDTVSFGTGEVIFPMNNFSIEIVFRSFGTVPTTGTAPALFGVTYGLNSYVNTTNLSFNAHDGVNANIATNTNDNVNYQDGRWYHATYTVSPSRIEIYVNGIYKNGANGTWNGTTVWATNTFNIGRGNNNNNYFFYGQIPLFKIYNKTLTRDEILTNFNAIRGRYGI